MFVRFTYENTSIVRFGWILDEERIEHTDHILDAEVFLNRFSMIASSSFESLG